MKKGFGRAVIMGCACVVTSRLTVEQYEKYLRFHPEALKLVDEDNRVLFSVGLDDGPGNISTEEAHFSRTKTPDGTATITVVIDPEVDDKAELISRELGTALLCLNNLEELLLEKIDALEEDIRKAEKMIIQIGGSPSRKGENMYKFNDELPEFDAADGEEYEEESVSEDEIARENGCWVDEDGHWRELDESDTW